MKRWMLLPVGAVCTMPILNGVLSMMNKPSWVVWCGGVLIVCSLAYLWYRLVKWAISKPKQVAEKSTSKRRKS
jgi:hypothetical protein